MYVRCIIIRLRPQSNLRIAHAGTLTAERFATGKEPSGLRHTPQAGGLSSYRPYILPTQIINKELQFNRNSLLIKDFELTI